MTITSRMPIPTFIPLLAATVFGLLFPLSAGALPQEPSVVSDEESEERRQELRQRLREAERQVNELRAALYSNDLARRDLARSTELAREMARRQREEARALSRVRQEEDRYAALLMSRAGALALMPQRARLGVTVRTRADAASDEVGAYLEEVTPDGPADAAGLRAGDVVTHWNGESLLEAASSDDAWAGSGSAGWSVREEAMSAPASRLIARSRRLEPEETVTLTYRRGGQESTATVTARPLPAPVVAPSPPIAPSALVAPRVPRSDDFFVLTLGGPWGDLEVVTVGEELGEYFGTDRGLLVIEPPSEDPFGLRAGDVILAIGDREPRDLPHALRILRSYEPEEEVNLTIRRKGESVTLSAALPESSSLFGRVPAGTGWAPAPPAATPPPAPAGVAVPTPAPPVE